MTKRDEAVEKILTDFSNQITAEIYWKLFIFRYFSHPQQQKAISPKEIKKRIEEECENDEIFKRFPQISKKSLREIADTYMNGNNLKIRRHQKKCTCIQQLPELLCVSNVQKLFNQEFPSPFIFGYYGFKWEKDWVSTMQKEYFHTSQYDIQITNSLEDETGLLEHYLSNPKFTCYYVYTIVKKYSLSDKLIAYNRSDRKYNSTAFFYLLKDNGSDDPQVTYLNSRSESWGDENYGIDLNLYLAGFGEKSRKDIGNCKIPVLLVYALKEYMENDFIPNHSSSFCPLFFFDSFTNILNILQNFDFEDEDIRKRKERIILLLKSMEEGGQKIDKLKMGEDSKYINEEMYKEDKIFYSDGVKKIFTNPHRPKK